MSEEKPTEAMASAMGKAFVDQLFSRLFDGVGPWITSLSSFIRGKYKAVSAQNFPSLASLQKAVAEERIRDGDAVVVSCRPAPFGPFLRNLFLTSVRMKPSHYRGPIPMVRNPLNVLGGAMINLLPVGLYPAMDGGLIQGCLYPTGESACGYIGLIPQATRTVARVPAVFSERFQLAFGHRCTVRGTMRFVSANVLKQLGCSIERYESLRREGHIWYLDATGDEAKCDRIDDQTTKIPPLWAGLYAMGHLELSEGQLPQAPVVEALRSALVDNGFGPPDCTQNQVGSRGWLISSPGIRCELDGAVPVFSMHMDVNLYGQLEENRKRFDAVAHKSLSLMADACKGKATLKNPGDLDFTYSNSDSAHTVMHSLAADQLADPIAIALRDWNRLRGKE